MSRLLRLWRMFYTMLYISAFTFGGGFVIVSLMKKKYVDQYGWLSEEEMLDMTALAQSTPGAIAVNAAILTGYRMAGFVGIAVSVIATILPPLIVLTVISFFYGAFRDSPAVQAVLRGMQAGVAAVICDVVLDLSRKVVKTRSVLSILLMGIAFVLVFFFKINVILLILSAALLGIAIGFLRKKMKQL
ncbi:MAG: chromate transporter [Clostridia bacterium]|nr:chromate transporter [Clostridia bacterium]